MRQNQVVRVIASDLDGTLLTPDKQVTSFTCEILAKAVSRGIRFVPCTGRPFDAVPQAVRELSGGTDIAVDSLTEDQVIFAIGNIAGGGRELMEYVRREGSALV